MISLVSDLHLDFKNNDQQEEILALFDSPTTDILIVAGDIASVHTVRGKRCWDKFYASVEPQYDHIIMVMGNHEHYFGDIITTPKIIKKEYPRINLLNRNHWIHPRLGYSIAGCTLWSHIKDKDQATVVVNSLLNCSYQENFFTVDRYNQLHDQDLNWIAKQQADIYLTHYPPTYRACQGKGGDNDYFCSDPENIFQGKRYWLAGHTHVRKDFHQDGCRIILNCLGHNNEYSNFKIKTFEI